MTMKHKMQKGFSLVTAIFLLVVLGGLGAVMMTFFTAQQQSSALDVLGSRAYQASRAGIEWGAYQVLRTAGGCVAASQVLPATTLAGTLSGFTVTVACTESTHSDDGTSVTMYQLTAKAQQGTAAAPDFVERQMSATIAR